MIFNHLPKWFWCTLMFGNVWSKQITQPRLLHHWNKVSCGYFHSWHIFTSQRTQDKTHHRSGRSLEYQQASFRRSKSGEIMRPYIKSYSSKNPQFLNWLVCALENPIINDNLWSYFCLIRRNLKNSYGNSKKAIVSPLCLTSQPLQLLAAFFTEHINTKWVSKVKVEWSWDFLKWEITDSHTDCGTFLMMRASWKLPKAMWRGHYRDTSSQPLWTALALCKAGTPAWPRVQNASLWAPLHGSSIYSFNSSWVPNLILRNRAMSWGFHSKPAMALCPSLVGETAKWTIKKQHSEESSVRGISRNGKTQEGYPIQSSYKKRYLHKT